MERDAVAAAMNEWQRRYIENPEQFEQEWSSISRTLQERAEGEEPSYGAVCADYLIEIIRQLANVSAEA